MDSATEPEALRSSSAVIHASVVRNSGIRRAMAKTIQALGEMQRQLDAGCGSLGAADELLTAARERLVEAERS